MSVTFQDLNLVTFPEQLDTFTQMLDITASDGPMIQRYMDAMNEGNQVLANEIFSQIPSGTQKVLKAVDLNKMSQAIQAVERFYQSDIYDHIIQNENKWRQEVLRFTFKETWSANKTYQQYNMVSFIVEDVDLLYIALKDVPANVAPTNTEYWRLLTVRGIQGIPGEGLSYMGDWNQYVNYTKNTSVTYDGGLWQSLNPNVGSVPSESSKDWKLVITLGATVYPIQPEPPTVMDIGGLWFNTNQAPTQYYYLLGLDNPALPEDIKQGKEAYDQVGKKIIGTGAF